jgi:hypothetical protein
MLWVIGILLVLLCVLGYTGRRMQGGRSYDGLTVGSIDHEYEKVQRKRIEEHDPYRGDPAGGSYRLEKRD